MSKLTDIKHQIDQLDGGTFQNLCDEYLTLRGYGAGYSLGMKTGTNKTAKGNPDTYFLTADGKYIFVMYTTQKDNFIKKALEDLGKCFDSSKTGLPPEDVKEIVYCHTCGRLLPGDSQQLHKFCEDRNTALTLIGLDELGSDLYLYFPRLAKDFLNISVDTGQITSMREFIRTHDANKMSAPLDTEFMFREKELKSAKEKLSQSDVLVLSGPAGFGKTRLALQLCKEIAAECGYEVLCIKSNGLELYDDLITTIETGKNYLVLVDDANELTGLYVFEKAGGKRGIYSAIVGQLLLHKNGGTVVAEKQEKWIQDTIEKHCMDQQRMYELFSAIEDHSANRRKNALEKFLKLNSDYALFEMLPLEASGWGGLGSLIPYMQERITYLTSLMPLLSGVAYLKHKQKVEHDIEIWKARIKSEEIQELFEALG